MRRHYDFSGAVRGKYAGKVDTTDVRRTGSTGPKRQTGDSRKKNGKRLGGIRRDIDLEIRHMRGDTLAGTLRKTYGPDFAPGNTRLDTLRKRPGASRTGSKRFLPWD